MKAAITGIGWANAASTGYGTQAVFAVSDEDVMPRLSKKDIFRKPFPHYGRLDAYSRLGIASIALALKDAGQDEWIKKRGMAIIASTVYGCIKTDRDYFDTVMPEGGRLASPNLFAYTLTNTYLGEAAIHFGLTGTTFVVNEPLLSGIPGLGLAIRGIARGEYESVLAGICDIGAPPSFAPAGRIVPQSLFFLLQNPKTVRGFSYGSLTQNKAGTLFFDGQKIEDLNSLARLCMATVHSRKRGD